MSWLLFGTLPSRSAYLLSGGLTVVCGGLAIYAGVSLGLGEAFGLMGLLTIGLVTLTLFARREWLREMAVRSRERA